MTNSMTLDYRFLEASLAAIGKDIDRLPPPKIEERVGRLGVVIESLVMLIAEDLTRKGYELPENWENAFAADTDSFSRAVGNCTGDSAALAAAFWKLSAI